MPPICTVNGAAQAGSKIRVNLPNGTQIWVDEPFSITGVNSTNPITNKSTGIEARFTTTKGLIAAGDAGDSLEIWPSLIDKGQYQNVDALPVNGALIKWGWQ